MHHHNHPGSIIQNGEGNHAHQCPYSPTNPSSLLPNTKGRDTSDGLAKDKSVDIMGSLVGIDGLKIHNMSNDVVLITNPISTQDIPHLPGNGQRFTATITFDKGDHFRGHSALILEPSDTKASLGAKGDLSMSIS